MMVYVELEVNNLSAVLYLTKFSNPTFVGAMREKAPLIPQGPAANEHHITSITLC